MKIYISLPISGKNIEEVRQRINAAKEIIISHGHTPVSPLEVSPNAESSYAEHMGKDIAALLECDGIMLLDGCEKSQGCKLECMAALIYEKEIF